jgi:hypothetical protein
MPDIDNSLVNESEGIGWPSWLPRCWTGVIGPGQIDFCGSDSIQLQTTFTDLDTSAIMFLGIKQGIIKLLGSTANESSTRSSEDEIKETMAKISQAWAMVREHKSLWRLQKEMSIKAFIRTFVCGLLDLEVGANKGDPTLEPYNDLFFYLLSSGK